MKLIGFVAVWFFLAQTPPTQAQSLRYAFTNLAGMPGGRGSADGTGAAAGFDRPSGLAVDAAGNVWVVESTRSTVRKIAPDGSISTLFKVTNLNSAKFGYLSKLTGLVLDQAGNIYVAAPDRGLILRVRANGEASIFAGQQDWLVDSLLNGPKDGVTFYLPEALALDGQGNLFVADNSTVRRIGPDGMVKALAGRGISAGSVDGTGAEARFNRPTSVAIDTLDNVWVLDGLAIRKITPAGVVITILKPEALEAAGVFWSSGIAADDAGDLYLTGGGRNVVFRCSADGRLAVIAGKHDLFGWEDGVGTSARFNFLAGVAVDRAGTLYVADSGNNQIVKGTPIPVPEPRLFNLALAEGALTLRVSGLVAGWTIILESSANMRDWALIQTNVAAGATLSFSRPASPARAAEFLRVIAN